MDVHANAATGYSQLGRPHQVPCFGSPGTFSQSPPCTRTPRQATPSWAGRTSCPALAARALFHKAHRARERRDGLLPAGPAAPGALIWQPGHSAHHKAHRARERRDGLLPAGPAAPGALMGRPGVRPCRRARPVSVRHERPCRLCGCCAPRCRGAARAGTRLSMAEQNKDGGVHAHQGVWDDTPGAQQTQVLRADAGLSLGSPRGRIREAC